MSADLVDDVKVRSMYGDYDGQAAATCPHCSWTVIKAGNPATTRQLAIDAAVAHIHSATHKQQMTKA